MKIVKSINRDANYILTCNPDRGQKFINKI